MRSLCTLWCLLALVLLVGAVWAQSAPPAARTPTSPTTPDPQARGTGTVAAWSCEVPVLQPTSLPLRHRLANVCSNYTGRGRVITTVACITEAGTLQFTPELTGGGATSILAMPLTCTATWTAGVLNGQPRVRAFLQPTLACPGHCTIDFIVANVTEVPAATLVIAGEYE